jgi:hypothetical protein
VTSLKEGRFRIGNGQVIGVLQRKLESSKSRDFKIEELESVSLNEELFIVAISNAEFAATIGSTR